MGFRTGAYAKVWQVNSVSDTITKLRISISRKNKNGDGYEQDFGGFVSVIGTAAARRAAKLHEGDRIKLGDVDVSTFYNKEKQAEYTTFKVFSFEVDGEQPSKPKKKPVDEVEPEPEDEDNDLPF